MSATNETTLVASETSADPTGALVGHSDRSQRAFVMPASRADASNSSPICATGSMLVTSPPRRARFDFGAPATGGGGGKAIPSRAASNVKQHVRRLDKGSYDFERRV